MGLWLWANRVRELSNRLACQANMKAIVEAMKIAINTASVPVVPSIDQLVQLGHIKRKQTLCPSSRADQCTYRWVANAARSASSRPGAVVMSEPKSNHGGLGGNLLYADGHAAFHIGEQYDAIVAKAGDRGDWLFLRRGVDH